MKEFAIHNFKFDENGRKFSKLVENTGKRIEITCYKQFLCFSLCFQKTSTADTVKQALVWERINDDGKADTAEQDQTACMYRLISLCTVCKVNPLLQTEGKPFLYDKTLD